MSAARGTNTPGRPWHLWVVGIAGTLWSLMGVISFMLTQLNVEAMMSRFPEQQRAYFASYPLWVDAFWAIGVFGGEIGCLLLVLKNRLAVPVLLVSMIGWIASTFGGLFLHRGMAVMRETGALGLTMFPVVIAVLLALYAGAARRKGLLN